MPIAEIQKLKIDLKKIWDEIESLFEIHKHDPVALHAAVTEKVTTATTTVAAAEPAIAISAAAPDAALTPATEDPVPAEPSTDTTTA